MTYVNMIVVNYKENSSNFIYNGQNDKIREREKEREREREREQFHL